MCPGKPNPKSHTWGLPGLQVGLLRGWGLEVEEFGASLPALAVAASLGNHGSHSGSLSEASVPAGAGNCIGDPKTCTSLLFSDQVGVVGQQA